jgi:hypothetical protein
MSHFFTPSLFFLKSSGFVHYSKTGRKPQTQRSLFKRIFAAGDSVENKPPELVA